MKLSCNQENLKQGLNSANKIISLKANLPILNNVLLATDKGRLKIASTDLEIGITTWIGAKIEKEGSITIPARLLSDYVNTNTDKNINMLLKDSVLCLESKRYRANIRGMETSDFPLIPEIKGKPVIKVKGEGLAKLINQTIFACAHDETRPILTGVLLKIHGSLLKLVATDSYRLTENSIGLDKKLDGAYQAIIPVRTMSELARIILAKENPEVEIFIGDNQIMFSLDNTQIISRLIEGTFPDYEQIIPKEHKTKVAVGVDDFSNIIKMASFFARSAANNIKIGFTKDKLLVSAISPQVGDTTSELEVEMEGEEVEIALNAKFLLDILGIANSEFLTFELNSGANPVVIKPQDSKNSLYIIMPLKVED